MWILPLSVYVRSRLQETPLNTSSAWGWTPEIRMVCLVYGYFRKDLTSERCLLRWTRLVSRWSLPARMKKSSCIQLTTPKLVNLNTLSMIHITWTQIIMRMTLTRVPRLYLLPYCKSRLLKRKLSWGAARLRSTGMQKKSVSCSWIVITANTWWLGIIKRFSFLSWEGS